MHKKKKNSIKKSYVEKTVENYQIFMLQKSPQFSNLLRNRFQILIAEIKDWNEGCVKISLLYLIYFPRYKPSKSVTVGLSRVGPVHYFKRFSWSENGHTSLSHIFPIFFKGFRADLMFTSERSERSSYQQSYMGRPVDIKSALKPLKKIVKM